MGGNFADFKTIKDSAFSLNVLATGDVSDDESFTFGLPGDTIKSQNSILSFMVLNSESAKLKVSINGTKVVDASLGLTPIGRCYQEICPVNILKDGKDNSITFEVTEGNCKISDVVLWFQNET